MIGPATWIIGRRAKQRVGYVIPFLFFLLVFRWGRNENGVIWNGEVSC